MHRKGTPNCTIISFQFIPFYYSNEILKNKKPLFLNANYRYTKGATGSASRMTHPVFNILFTNLRSLQTSFTHDNKFCVEELELIGGQAE